MHQLFDLEGKIAIVTGGLGQLGSAFSSALLGQGARVVAVVTHERPESVLQEVAGENRENLLQVTGDVTSEESMDAVLQACRKIWGEPEILINNAGIDSQPNASADENGPFEEFPKEIWDRVLEVNLTGVFVCCKIFGAAMAAEGRGSIINIGSIYGLLSPQQPIYAYREERDGKPFFKPVSYSASKSGLLNLTRYLGTYWGRSGVRVNLVTFAGVYRPTQDDQFVKNYTDRIPIGRMASTDDYIGPILFLASEASRYMVGSNMIVDGGWTAW
jgi:NAD(P)-dependent dehydrogenase (short-subunit alcohol dehydrogenase family)